MKYPYIGKSDKSGCTILFTKSEYGFCTYGGVNKQGDCHVDCVGEYSGDWSEGCFKNITREYLSNTYGKVESKEHAEFIVELFNNNGLELTGRARNSGYFYTYESEGGLGFCFCLTESLAGSSGEKLITIPLPPKQIQTATSEEEFEMKQIMKNNGDNLVLGCESQLPKTKYVYGVKEAQELAFKADAAIKTLESLNYRYHGGELWKPPVGKPKFKSNDFPKAGDKVVLHGRPCMVIGVDGDAFWIKKENGRYDIASRHQLQKPKTPEEELRDDLIELYCTAGYETEKYIDLIMDKYNITKKPQ